MNKSKKEFVFLSITKGKEKIEIVFHHERKHLGIIYITNEFTDQLAKDKNLFTCTSMTTFSMYTMMRLNTI